MDNEAVKKALMQQVLVESSQANAKMLVEAVNNHCFDACVSKPGTSLSTAEKNCNSQCLERYMAAWNTVHEKYMDRAKTMAEK